jgi:hypothetical protein
MKAKKCATCHKPLGLGIRFKNLWTGISWIHVRFCSERCLKAHEAALRAKNNQAKWFSSHENAHH